MIKKIEIIISLFILFVLSSCKEKKPWEYTNTIWYSTNPKIEITTYDGTDLKGVYYVDDIEYSFTMYWVMTYSFMFVKPDIDIISDDSVLLSGKIKNYSEKTVLIIDDDKIFDNKYSKIELFHKQIETL